MKSCASKLLFVSLAVVSVAACKAKVTPESGDASTSAASMSASAKPAEVAAEIPVDQFIAKLAPSTCKMFDECKNDKLKVVVSASAMMIAGFGSMGDPEAQKQVSAVDKSMKADKRFIPNNAECTTIGNIAVGVMGMKADDVKGRIGKTVNYDAKKAASCIASVSTPPEVCKTEAKVTTEPKMSDIDSMSKELKPALESYAKACEEVMTGMVEPGGACEFEFECKGKDMKCKTGAPGAKAAKGTKPTKTCQSKK